MDGFHIRVCLEKGTERLLCCDRIKLAGHLGEFAACFGVNLFHAQTTLFQTLNTCGVDEIDGMLRGSASQLVEPLEQDLRARLTSFE